MPSSAKSRPVAHAYTNLVVEEGDLVHKRYRGGDACARQEREELAVRSLKGRLPVVALVSSYPGEMISRKVPGLHGQDVISGGEGDRVMLALGQLLRDLQAIVPSFYPEYDNSGVLVHGDFGPNNVLLGEHDDGVVLIADWEWSTIGDPVDDLAWAEFVVRMHHPEQIGCLSALFDGYGRRPPWSERQVAMTRRAAAMQAWSMSWKGQAGAGPGQRRIEAIAKWKEVGRVSFQR